MSGDLKNMTKYFLFFINCVTFICGLVLFFLGIVLQTRYKTYFEFMDNSLYSISIWCLVMGVIVCLVSFLGLYGSVKEDYCSLLAFSVTLTVVISVELALGVAAFALAQQNRLASSIANKMIRTMSQYGENEHDGVTKVWDILQTDFECCGVDFPGDWAMTPWARKRARVASSSEGARVDAGAADADGLLSGGEMLAESPFSELPSSCCAALPYDAGARGVRKSACVASAPDAHAQGCIAALEQSSVRNAGALGVTACVIGLGQIFLVIAATNLIKQLKRPQSCYPFY